MLYFQSVLYPTWCICLLAYWPWYIELYRLRIHMSCSGSWQGDYPFAGCSSEWFCQPVERTPVPNFLHLMLTWKRCMFPVHTAAVLISLTTKTFSDPRGSHVGGKIGTTEDRAGGGGSLMRSPGSRQSCRYWPAVSKVPPLFETLPTWPGRVSFHPDSTWGPHTMTLPYVSQHVLALEPHTMTLPCVLPAWPHLMFPNLTSSYALPCPHFLSPLHRSPCESPKPSNKILFHSLTPDSDFVSFIINILKTRPTNHSSVSSRTVSENTKS